MEIKREILHRYLMGSATEEEKKELVSWVDEDPKHFEELKAYGLIYDADIFYGEYSAREKTFNAKNVMPNESSVIKRSVFRRFSVRFIRNAAVFALGFGLCMFLWEYTNRSKQPEMLSLYAPVGQRAVLTLGDGTQVWLNANSRITYPVSFGKDQRKVILKGEAYFKVKHDVSRPFIVNAGGYEIRDVGTEFNVKAYDKKNYELSLVKGEVHVTTPDNKEADLRRGSRVFIDNNQTVKGEILHPEHFQWRTGLISFESESLQDIFHQIELFYDVKIVVDNTQVLENHYTGKFRVRDGVQHVINVLKMANNFKYEMNRNRDTIRIE